MPQHLEYYQTAGHVIAAGVSLAIVDIVTVVLKFCVRKKYKQPLKADDWLLVPALVGREASFIHVSS
jgi:hypothetical protein